MPLLEKPASSVNNMQLLKRDLHHTVKGTTDKVIGASKNQRHLEFVPICERYRYSNCSWRSCQPVMHTTCSAACT
jgi:hypothetical protein